MPASHVTAEIAAKPGEAWALLRDPEGWAHLMPGYVSHEALDSKTYRWTIQRNLGLFAKTVIAEVQIADEEVQQRRAAFTLKGINESFEGQGEVHLEPNAKGARLALQFSIRALGSMAPMVNPVLAQQMPKVMEAFAARLAAWAEDELSAGR